MYSCFGFVTIVVPMQLLEFMRLIAITAAFLPIIFLSFFFKGVSAESISMISSVFEGWIE